MLVGIPPYYNDDMKVLYNNIEKGKLKLPKYLSNEAKKLLLRLLHKDPKKRPRLVQLKTDPFFEEIDWDALERKELAPPQILCKEEGEDDMEKKKKEAEEAGMTFEDPGDNPTSVEPVLEDIDYTLSNKNF